MDSFGMNTQITYKVFGDRSDKAAGLAKAEIIRLENKLSRFITDSEVSRINRSAGRRKIQVSSETFGILAAAVRLSEITSGLFDITITPLINLWDYKHSIHVPNEAKIKNALSNVDFRDLTLDLQNMTAGLEGRNEAIDLGGIAKGYASDCCMKVFEDSGIKSAFVNIGGNVSTLGNKPEGTPWNVGIRHPRQDGRLLGAVKVSGKAVVTSGDYERYFIDREGKRWHHLLDPFTGYPAEAGLISVTVVADSAMTADALSTAIFVAGRDRGLEFLEHFPGTEAILVDSCLQVFITKGLKDNFQAVEGIKVSIAGKEQV